MNTNKSGWVQPAPTKAYAAYYKSAWYGQGDTPSAARHDVNVAAQACPSRFWGECKRNMVIRLVNPDADYVAEGLGEW